MNQYRINIKCRLCESLDLVEVLRLPDTPLANEFKTIDDIKTPQDLFPLYISRCTDCGHIQLPIVVDPKRLFKNYAYVSGTSHTFVNHFKLYADETVAIFGLKPGDLVVEIGSNDGTSLQFYKDFGLRVVGIDPASEIASNASSRGIPTIPDFFSESVAENILQFHGSANLVVANNVFAHIDDLKSVAINIKRILKKDSGIFRFEVQYAADLLKDGLFDMIYHEHLSYHTIEPLIRFFSSLNMSVIDVEMVSTHGGSIRVTVSPKADLSMSSRTESLILFEQATMRMHPVEALAEKITINKLELKRALAKFDSIIGYGAPAKLTTLNYTFEIDGKSIKFVVDDNSLKHGLFTPGSFIPIFSSDKISNNVTKDTGILLYAWNFEESIISKYPQFQDHFIIPLPTPRVA